MHKLQKSIFVCVCCRVPLQVATETTVVTIETDVINKMAGFVILSIMCTRIHNSHNIILHISLQFNEFLKCKYHY